MQRINSFEHGTSSKFMIVRNPTLMGSRLDADNNGIIMQGRGASCNTLSLLIYELHYDMISNCPVYFSRSETANNIRICHSNENVRDCELNDTENVCPKCDGLLVTWGDAFGSLKHGASHQFCSIPSARFCGISLAFNDRQIRHPAIREIFTCNL